MSDVVLAARNISVRFGGNMAVTFDNAQQQFRLFVLGHG